MVEEFPVRAWSELPVLVTEVPGPESVRIAAEERRLLSEGGSAGSAWAQLAIVEGSGAMVLDADGNQLLDACAGTVVMNIGHGRPEVADAIHAQASRLVHFYDFPHQLRVEFLRRLAASLHPSLDAFHLTNSGAEAVEAALRVARSATGRHEVIAFHHGFHGRTLGAISLTAGASRAGLGPLLPGVFHTPSAYCYRCAKGASPAECAAACADLLEQAASQVLSGDPAAVVIEPFQGAGGMIPMPAEFLQRLRDFCDRSGALLVFDEILSGAGRTGRMWAYEHSGVVPDLITLGKGLGGGYPLGVLAGRRALMDAGPGSLPNHNSSTFGGGLLACAAGSAALGVLERENLVDNAARVGTVLVDELQRRLADHPMVGEVRGLGLAVGVEMVTDRTSKRPVGPNVSRGILVGLLRRGVVISSSSHVVRITPPLCISEAQALYICDAFEEVLAQVNPATRSS